MTKRRFVTEQELVSWAQEQLTPLALAGASFYGIPTGGTKLLALVGQHIPDVAKATVDFPVAKGPAGLVLVDDLIDSGRTFRRWTKEYPGAHFQTFASRPAEWLVFPWEVDEGGVDRSSEDWVVRLLQSIGEDPEREGLKETPARVVKAWREWASGYDIDVPGLFKTFNEGGQELVAVHGIPVTSKCEHHLADIVGVAHVAYIPNGKVVGLSKLARVVDAFSRRLQVQERMTQQIADAINDNLNPLGVAVLVQAAHHCMSTRGVRVHGALTTTSAVRGVFKTDAAARAEFYSLCQLSEGRS